MTIKEAKIYLGQAYKIDRRININLRKIEAMRASLYGASAPPMDREPSGVHNSKSSIESAIEKVSEYEERTNQLIDILVDKKSEIENTIKNVADKNEREVLERRYILYQPWESHYDKYSGKYITGIDESMSYSVRHIYRLHGRALKNFIKTCQ